MWVPGHEAHVGNERADLLAKKGACSPFTGPEPFCRVKNGFHYKEIRSWSKHSLLEWWSAQPVELAKHRCCQLSMFSIAIVFAIDVFDSGANIENIDTIDGTIDASKYVSAVFCLIL